MDELEKDLSMLVGLSDLKVQLREWAKGILMDEKRREMGLDVCPRKMPHMAFFGNPGTGKMMVARMITKLLVSIGMLSSMKIIEVGNSELMETGDIDGTRRKTKAKIKEAIGGVLFVDEVNSYHFTDGNRFGDYGMESLKEITSAMNEQNLLVFFATNSYTTLTNNYSSNRESGLRFCQIFGFNNSLTCNEFAEMMILKMTKQNNTSPLRGLRLHSACTIDEISEIIETNYHESYRKNRNGDLMDDMLLKAKKNLDCRLTLNAKGDKLIVITLDDLIMGARDRKKFLDNSVVYQSKLNFSYFFPLK